MRTATRRTLIGDQEIYTHLSLMDLDALGQLEPELAAHWATATARYQRLAEFAVPTDQLKPLLAQLVDLENQDFGLTLRTARWFAAYPRSGLTMRQVPVPGLHTKWLAKHRRVVLGLLRVDSTHPDSEEVDLTANELDLLGLRTPAPEADIILADPRDRQRVGGLRHLRAPVEEIAALPLHPRHVIVIENKESALPVPDQPGLVVIHSLGNNLEPLSVVPWLNEAAIWYWGDLDRAGITLLSRARKQRASVISLLMDRQTLEQHIDMAVPDPTQRVHPPEPTLTASELDALTALTRTTEPLRLEQERIPWDHVQECLAELLKDTP
jgi:hypothetical protein